MNGIETKLNIKRIHRKKGLGDRLLFIITTGLVLSLLIFAGCQLRDNRREKISKEMIEYLRNSYGIEFEIKKLNIIYHSPYGYYTYDARAIPKGHPELEFKIFGSDIDQIKYGDYYLLKKWSYQGRQDFNKTLQELYGDKAVSNSFLIDFNYKKYKDLYYTEVLKQCNNDLSIDIEYLVFSDDRINKQQEAEKVFTLLKKHVLLYDIRKYWVLVYYFPAKYKSESQNILYKKEILQDGTKVYKGADHLYQENGMINHINFKRPVIVPTKNGVKELEYKPIEINDIITAFKY